MRLSGSALVIVLLSCCGVVAGVVMTAPRAVAATSAGACNGFAKAKTLGKFTIGNVTLPVCGPRPAWDNVWTKVYPYPGAPGYDGYQCMELVTRYLHYRWGVSQVQANGDQAVDNYFKAYKKKFTKYNNGSVGHAPVPGDILSLSLVSTFNHKDGGHTGVVVSSKVNSSGNGSIRVAEQNFDGATWKKGYHDYVVSRWKVQYRLLPYIKWLHPLGTAPTFTAASPPSTATVGDPYNYTFKASGSPAPTFSVASGSLPSGLSLSPAGILSGMPRVASTNSFAIKASNSGGTATTKTLKITVAGGSSAVWGPATVMRQPAGPVACASPAFCLMPGLAKSWVWKGTAWANASKVPNDGADFWRASCATSTWCLGGGYNGDVWAWTGSRWGARQVVLPNDGDPSGNTITGVACVTASFCIVTSTHGEWSRWNGSSWTAPADLPIVARDLSCPSTSFCMVAGDYYSHTAEDWVNATITFDGTSWSAPRPPTDNQWRSVSCTSPSFCMMLGSGGDIRTWNGSTWAASAKAPLTKAVSVACSSSRRCVIVDSSRRAAVYNGAGWSTSVLSTTGPAYSNISCVRNGLCAAYAGESMRILQ